MSNRLAHETSPYLRQHADNPVDWYPWGEEALARARAEDKPILLSIGYSACHWCHVMAHESFEDEATARVMNELYVNVKVDREERPDLDKLYQLAHQALAQRGGGWPLTVFLTPDDHLPFFAGTYFPNAPRHGMPPFTHVLTQVREWYDSRRDEVRAQNRSLADFLAAHGAAASAADSLDASLVEATRAQLARSFDPRHGGFGRAPKFPHASDMELLLALGAQSDLATVGKTLEAMMRGGIHDQLGGGFCRYSVDGEWAIPHFEKMLYDNAQLLPLYARGAALFGREDFAATARDIVAWLEREMRAPDGGYFAALDADSEGEEGKFYVWTRDEARAALDDAEWAVAEHAYGFDRPPNFEHHAWNPIFVAAAPESARAKLLAARAKRVRPGTDDKVLTSWNALMAAGLARAARYAREHAWGERAIEILHFIRARVRRDDGRLHATFQAGRARFDGYLDDHAFALDALLEALQFRFDAALLAWATELAEILLAQFEDREHGGFFFTAHDHEKLIARSKPFTDESLPSGNAVAVRALTRLGHLLGETRYVDAADRALKAARAALADYPHAGCAAVHALHDFLDPPAQVVVRADDDAWRDAVARLHRRGIEAFLIPRDTYGLAGLLEARKPIGDGVAYVCRGVSCLAPVTEPAALDRLL